MTVNVHCLFSTQRAQSPIKRLVQWTELKVLSWLITYSNQDLRLVCWHLKSVNKWEQVCSYNVLFSRDETTGWPRSWQHARELARKGQSGGSCHGYPGRHRALSWQIWALCGYSIIAGEKSGYGVTALSLRGLCVCVKTGWYQVLVIMVAVQSHYGSSLCVPSLLCYMPHRQALIQPQPSLSSGDYHYINISISLSLSLSLSEAHHPHSYP